MAITRIEDLIGNPRLIVGDVMLTFNNFIDTLPPIGERRPTVYSVPIFLTRKRKKGKFDGFDEYAFSSSGALLYILNPENRKKLSNGEIAMHCHPDKDLMQFKAYTKWEEHNDTSS